MSSLIEDLGEPNWRAKCQAREAEETNEDRPSLGKEVVRNEIGLIVVYIV